MDQEAGGWKSLLRTADQLIRVSTHPAAVMLPVEGRMPSLDGATGWLNSPPLRTEDLRGHVVLVDFCTYTCINWLRTLPYLRAWAEKYQRHGLVVIGVHTPEFDVEHDLDNDYAVWTAFDNHYWPALFAVDAEGQIRYHHFGEGEYEQSEMVVQQLLIEAGASLDQQLVSVDPAGVEVQADWDSLWSPENYLGSDRTENFASRDGAVLGAPHVYAAPPQLRLNQWALTGDWTVQRQAVVLNAAGGQITYRFHARDLNVVMGPAGRDAPVRFQVRVDGQPPGAAHGVDADDQGQGTVDQPRLYQLIRQPQPVAERTAEITFLDPGLRGLSFTFG